MTDSLPCLYKQGYMWPGLVISCFVCISGILMMISLCEEVNVYEYIPSLRQTDLCHYHERYYDAACTLGAYHPLLYEKMLIQRMNEGTENDLKKKGKVTLPGFKKISCEPWAQRHINWVKHRTSADQRRTAQGLTSGPDRVCID